MVGAGLPAGAWRLCVGSVTLDTTQHRTLARRLCVPHPKSTGREPGGLPAGQAA